MLLKGEMPLSLLEEPFKNLRHKRTQRLQKLRLQPLLLSRMKMWFMSNIPFLGFDLASYENIHQAEATMVS